MNSGHRAQLESTLSKYSIECSNEQIDLLFDYTTSLWDWNTKLNLTRHTDFEKFVTRDLTDSLRLSTLLKSNENVVDLGTGGGVPGILLAILRPDLQVSLCESVAKKANAVDDIVQNLNLPITVFHSRLEHLLDDFRFDTVVARAVGPLWKICYWLQDGWASIGRMLAIKGPNWTEERKEARHRGLLNDLELRCELTYMTPGTEIESVILKLWPKGRVET